ncbi:MAG: nucleic acid-binding protein [Clostridia bacterium]
MRNCIRCHLEMIEDLEFRVEALAYGVKLTKQGIFKESLGKIKCAACPECGYIETYVEDTSKLKNIK